MDPALVELYEDGSADDTVSVILRLEPGEPPPHVRIVAQFGPIATCRLRRGDIPMVRAYAQVLSMKAARFYGPTLEPREASPGEKDPGEEDGDLDITPTDIRRPEGRLPTGAGVVIAHIDWGMDFTCPAFRNEDGSTRLLALWDQAAPYDPARPNRYGYGRIHLRAEIDSALRANDPCGALGYAYWTAAPNGGSHGTHTTSISAGNGRDGGPEGVAPGADIVFIDLSTRTPEGPTPLGDSVAFLEALDFAARCAGGRPLVVNASLGRQAGQKDGQCLTEKGIDAFMLEAPGRAVVQSAGNYFEKDAHTSRLIAPGGVCVLHAEMPRGTGEAEIDLWYRGTDRLGVQLIGPPGIAAVSAPPGTRAAIMFHGRSVGRLYHRVDDPNNHDTEVFLTLEADAPEGGWELRLTGDHVADGRIHAWIERIAPGAQRRMRFVADEVRREITLGTICTSFWSVAVAAHDAHGPERAIARFSSSGGTRDHRRLKPFITAPGVRILASRSRPRTGSAPALIRMQGTSMAAPHVTGTVALMFAAAPRPLTIHDVRSLLTATADPVPDDAPPSLRLRLGVGYLNVGQAVEAAGRIPLAAGKGGQEAVSIESILAARPDGEGGGGEGGGGEGGSGEGGGGQASGDSDEDAGWTMPPMVELSDAEMAELGSDGEGGFADRRARGWGPPPAPLPFQFDIPLGGGPLGLAVPLGGPFAFTLPLGGTPPPAQAPAAAATPAQNAAAAPTLAAAARSDEPVTVATFDVSSLAGTQADLGERILVADADYPHSAAAFDGLAAALDRDAPAPMLSATRLFGWLGTGGPGGLARRIERALPGGKLAILALPNAQAAGLELRPGDLLVRAARGQRFGCLALIASPVTARASELAERGWRGEGDPDPLPGRYVLVTGTDGWAGNNGLAPARPLARRIATGAGLVPPDTMLLRLDLPEYLTQESGAAAEEAPPRPMLRLGSRGDAVREAQGKLNLAHARNLQSGGPGLSGGPLVADGIFGTKTLAAVKDFQRWAFPDAPREWDGVIGPHGWSALDTIPIGPGPSPGPLPVPPSPVPPSPALAAGVAAGREVIQHLPLLAGHRGTAPDLILKWNDMTAVPAAIDVVVHLHGHSGARAAMRIDVDKEPASGLDFADPQPPHEAGRTAPALLILPRGNSNQNDDGKGYDFPAIIAPGGLERLVAEALARFAARIGADRVTPGRLILTAHSGGGAALIALLASGRDPDEVHLFDAIYQEPAAVVDWARRRLAAGSPNPALRVLYLEGGSTEQRSLRLAPAVARLVPTGDPSARRLRVEATTTGHTAIPPRFGWRLLRDAGEDLPLRGGPPPTPPSPGPAPGPAPDPAPGPAPGPARGPGASGAVAQDAVQRLSAISFGNAAELNAIFAPLGSFQDWFNAELAGQGPFRRAGGGGVLRMPVSAPARSRFDGFWNRLRLAYDAPRISLLEFASLICIVMNETDGDFAARTESSGRGHGGRTDATGPHPGLAYFFDRIELRPGRWKASYNRLGRSAGSLFNDPAFIAAHGARGGATELARHGDDFGGAWNGERYAQERFSTDEADDGTAFIREADFYKFRGRGVIQTTGRGAYVPFVRFVQAYAGDDAALTALKARWAPLAADEAATASANADWDAVFQSPDALARALALHAGTGARDYRPMSRDAALLQAVPDGAARAQAGSIVFMGFRISGSQAYARAEYRDRVVTLLGAMDRVLNHPAQPSPQPSLQLPPVPPQPAPISPAPSGPERPVPAPDETAARAQWESHPGIHAAFHGQFAFYLQMAPLYAARGVGDAADYLQRNIVDLSFFGHRSAGHRDFLPVLAAAEAAIGPAGLVPAIARDGFGCFNVRPIRGTLHSLSNHALGRAIDLNPGSNPRITEAADFLVIDAVTGGSLLTTRDPASLRGASDLYQQRFGEAWIAAQTRADIIAACQDRAVRARLDSYGRNGFCTLDQRLIEALISGGLRWGGTYRTNKDFMHFEFVHA